MAMPWQIQVSGTPFLFSSVVLTLPELLSENIDMMNKTENSILYAKLGKLPEKEHCDLGWIASGGKHSSFHWFLWNENKQMEVNAFLKLCMCVQLLQS